MRAQIAAKRAGLAAKKDALELEFNRVDEAQKIRARNLDALTGAIQSLDELLAEPEPPHVDSLLTRLLHTGAPCDSSSS